MMFRLRKLEENPLTIYRKDLKENRFVYGIRVSKGEYYRVIPSNMKEINFMLLLQKHVEYEVPAHGDGVLVTTRVLPLSKNGTRKTS